MRLQALVLVIAWFASYATAAPAQRIVSLAPHLTELAFDAGAGDRVIATVEYSDHPAAAREIPRVGDAFRVDLERLIALRPDAVLAWDSGTPVQTVERIRGLGLRVISYKIRRLDDVADVLRDLGQLVGTEAVAARAAAEFESEVAALRARYRGRAPLRVFLQINDRPLYTVNGEHIMSEILELCGGRNVFADLAELAPAIGIEAVIASEPQVILSTDDTVPDAAAMWRDWKHVEAVRTGNVYTMRSDDIARSTRRLTVGAQTICRALDTARQKLRTARVPASE